MVSSDPDRGLVIVRLTPPDPRAPIALVRDGDRTVAQMFAQSAGEPWLVFDPPRPSLRRAEEILIECALSVAASRGLHGITETVGIWLTETDAWAVPTAQSIGFRLDYTPSYPSRRGARLTVSRYNLDLAADVLRGRP